MFSLLTLFKIETQFMDFNFKQSQQGNREPVKILGEELDRVTHFEYLGTSMEEEGGMETEITKWVGAGWRNWKKCSGLLCDRRMPVKLKGKVIRPAMPYVAETWATRKRQEQLIEVTEMRMLRWMCGVTRKDKIRNEHTRGTTRVALASKKLTERRLNWYGHVMRRDDEHILTKVLRADISGKMKRGRPKTRRPYMMGKVRGKEEEEEDSVCFPVPDNWLGLLCKRAEYDVYCLITGPSIKSLPTSIRRNQLHHATFPFTKTDYRMNIHVIGRPCKTSLQQLINIEYYSFLLRYILVYNI